MAAPDHHRRPDCAEMPAVFVERMRGLLGAETDAFLAALETPSVGLRVNTLRVHPARFEDISPFDLAPLRGSSGGYVVKGGPRPGKHPYHAAGLYYLQDPGAMMVAPVVGPRPGERVLDLAAAPGGKATHLAALMEGAGLLVANDVQPARARELAGNLERLGVRNAAVTCDSAQRLAGHFGPSFDRVLLDAPCSGESMFHKSEAARGEWSPSAVAGCARRQGDLLGWAAGLVRPGGLLVYSTCTFGPEENEGAIAAFLASNPEFEIEARTDVPGALPGRPDWLPPGDARVDVSRTLRLWPHRAPGAGHFIAALRKTDGDEAHLRPAAPPRPTRQARELLGAFQREALTTTELDEGRLAVRGTEIYQLPDPEPETGSLRVVVPGLRLGNVLKDRFEPAHALAMALPAERVTDPVVLGPDDPRVAAYLRGETIRASGRGGWVLVTVDGFPLGWGKRVGDTVKNHYPKGLRQR